MNRLKIIIPVVSICILLDQITKIIAKAHLQQQKTMSFLWDSFRLTYAENRGAFLSLGANWPDWLRFYLLTGVVTIALIGFIIYIFVGKGFNTRSLLAMSLIIGGGVSNQVDRIFQGSVVDFMNMGIYKLRTGIFNVADMAIMAGFFIMILFNRPPKSKQTEQPKISSDK